MMNSFKKMWRTFSNSSGGEPGSFVVAVIMNLVNIYDRLVGGDREIGSACVLFLFYLLMQLSTWGQKSHIIPEQKGQRLYRLDGNSGLWCAMLVPMAISVSEAYRKSDTCADFTLLMAVISFIYKLLTLRERTWLDTILLYCMTGFTVYLLGSALSGLIVVGCLAYIVLLATVPSTFPSSFTFGEASMTTQMVTFMLYRATESALLDENQNSCDVLAAIIFLSVMLASLLYAMMSRLSSVHSWLTFYLAYGLTAIVFSLPCLWFWNKQTALILYLIEMFTSKTAVLLIIWWLACVLASVLFVCILCMDLSMATKASESSKNMDQPVKQSTVARKYFHLAVLAVFIPGLVVHPQLLYLATVLAAGVLVIIETARLYKIPPFGPIIDQYYKVFLDPQDSGDLILTPIYLLIGCSIPCWISDYDKATSSAAGAPLCFYAGVLSVGFGDSAASVIGSQFGRIHWPGSRKTLEGSVASAVVQLLVILILSNFGVPDSAVTLRTVSAVVLISVLEAVTTQIDNLVLPVVMYKLLAGGS